MSRLRTPASVVSLAMKMRSEGMGIRASWRVVEPQEKQELYLFLQSCDASAQSTTNEYANEYTET